MGLLPILFRLSQSRGVAQTGLEFEMLLHQPREFWDYMCALPLLIVIIIAADVMELEFMSSLILQVNPHPKLWP